MKKMKVQLFFLFAVLIVMNATHGWADEKGDITIEKTNGKSEAMFQADQVPEKQTRVERAEGAAEKVEESVVDTMATSTTLIGKGTDKTVGAVQKVTDETVGKLFRLVDFDKNSKQEPLAASKDQ